MTVSLSSKGGKAPAIFQLSEQQESSPSLLLHSAIVRVKKGRANVNDAFYILAQVRESIDSIAASRGEQPKPRLLSNDQEHDDILDHLECGFMGILEKEKYLTNEQADQLLATITALEHHIERARESQYCHWNTQLVYKRLLTLYVKKAHELTPETIDSLSVRASQILALQVRGFDYCNELKDIYLRRYEADVTKTWEDFKILLFRHVRVNDLCESLLHWLKNSDGSFPTPNILLNMLSELPKTKPEAPRVVIEYRLMKTYIEAAKSQEKVVDVAGCRKMLKRLKGIETKPYRYTKDLAKYYNETYKEELTPSDLVAIKKEFYGKVNIKSVQKLCLNYLERDGNNMRWRQSLRDLSNELWLLPKEDIEALPQLVRKLYNNIGLSDKELSSPEKEGRSSSFYQLMKEISGVYLEKTSQPIDGITFFCEQLCQEVASSSDGMTYYPTCDIANNIYSALDSLKEEEIETLFVLMDRLYKEADMEACRPAMYRTSNRQKWYNYTEINTRIVKAYLKQPTITKLELITKHCMNGHFLYRDDGVVREITIDALSSLSADDIHALPGLLNDLYQWAELSPQHANAHYDTPEYRKWSCFVTLSDRFYTAYLKCTDKPEAITTNFFASGLVSHSRGYRKYSRLLRALRNNSKNQEKLNVNINLSWWVDYEAQVMSQFCSYDSEVYNNPVLYKQRYGLASYLASIRTLNKPINGELLHAMIVDIYNDLDIRPEGAYLNGSDYAQILIAALDNRHLDLALNDDDEAGFEGFKEFMGFTFNVNIDDESGKQAAEFSYKLINPLVSNKVTTFIDSSDDRLMIMRKYIDYVDANNQTLTLSQCGQLMLMMFVPRGAAENSLENQRKNLKKVTQLLCSTFITNSKDREYIADFFENISRSFSSIV